jgi:membrane associated rhomboid family serine protease
MPAGVLAALFLANDVYGMLQGPQSSKIAHSAHLGGALFGAVWVGLRLFLR